MENAYVLVLSPFPSLEPQYKETLLNIQRPSPSWCSLRLIHVAQRRSREFVSGTWFRVMVKAKGWAVASAPQAPTSASAIPVSWKLLRNVHEDVNPGGSQSSFLERIF